jgi:hypothetical protein
MRTAGPWLLVGWLVAALLVLGMDGRLPAFLAGAVPGSLLLLLGVGSVVRQQLAPLRYNRPSIPERYRVADDLCRPLTEVVAAAEQEAIAPPPAQRWARDGPVVCPTASHFHRSPSRRTCRERAPLRAVRLPGGGRLDHH